MRWTEHVAHTAEKRVTKVLVVQPGDLDVDVRIILRWFLKK
jgi:hypothetical protein